MFKKILFIAAACVLSLAGCKNETANTSGAGTETATADTAAAPTPAPAAAQPVDRSAPCYIHAEGRDTTFLTIVTSDADMKGSLHWHPWEKDGAHGNLRGKVQNGVIDAVYSYTIEGSAQQEQVMFRMEGENFVQIVGELEDKGGILKIKDPSKPVRTVTFVKGPCNKLD